MTLLASAFGSFVLFTFLGLLSLVVAAMLDRKVGKERALFGWVVVLLLFTMFVLAPKATSAQGAKAKPEDQIPAARRTRATSSFPCRRRSRARDPRRAGRSAATCPR
jgi:hypothetical protein